MRGAVAFAGGALVGALAGQGVAPAWADFRTSASSSASFSADVLLPPSEVTASPSCGALGVQADLDWVASPSTWIDGYEVATSTTAGGPYTPVPVQGGQDPRVTTRSVGLQGGTVYSRVVRATKGGWTASSAEVSVRTRPRCR